MYDWLLELNAQQQAAVTARPGPVLVMAGPGSGKTRVLTYRVAWLLAEGHARPWNVLAVTFTNKAAREMAERLDALLGTRTRGLTVSTFHAFCARTLRREAQFLPFTASFVIADEDDQRRLLRHIIRQELQLDDKVYRVPAVRSAISRAKNEGHTPETFPRASYRDEVVAKIYARYQQHLAEANLLDFDDLLLWAVRLFEEQPEVRARYQDLFRHLLVDEFQDTNAIQYRLVQLLGQAHRQVFVVGDMDQSIYRWRGADYRNLQRFEADFPDAQVIYLEENYRSTQNILDVAMAVLHVQPRRHRKNLRARRGSGPPVVVKQVFNEEAEAAFIAQTAVTLARQRGIPLDSMAVMYRTNAQSRPVEEELLRLGLPYRLVGAQRFYGRREIKDLVAFLRLAFNPDDVASLERVINVPPRGIGPRTWAALREQAAARGLSPGRALLDLAAHPEAWTAALSRRALKALFPVGEMLQAWHWRVDELSPAQMLDRIVADTGYEAFVRDRTEEGEARWENVQELRRLAVEYDDQGLAAFLERVALVSDQDTLQGQEQGLTLLTIHAAKGLEFRVVFLVGLVEGLLPHNRSIEDPDALAEEQRLLYVGITRARDYLFLLVPQYRLAYGGLDIVEPSRFLEPLAPPLTEGDWPRLFPHLARQLGVGERRSASGRAPARASRAASRPAPRRPRRARLRSGDRVIHPRWGEGVVLQVEVSAGDEIVEVRFEDGAVKMLLADFVQKL